MKFLPKLVRRTWLQLILLVALIAFRILLEAFPEELKKHPDLAPTMKIVGTFIFASIFSSVVGVLAEMHLFEGRMSESIRTLLSKLFRLVIYAFAILVSLETMGVSVTPVLASLGVGSLAVGLALQDTLGNWFSGIFLYIDQPVAVGHYIRLDNGMEGQILAIGWRTTHVAVNGGDNTLVIPNSKLATSFITNYSMPYARVPISVDVGVAYDTDLEKAERVAQEVAVELIRRRSGSDPGDVPAVRFVRFSESSIDMTVSLKARDFTDQGPLRHEFMKALKKRFDEEGIEIPFPQRVVRSVGGPAGSPQA